MVPLRSASALEEREPVLADLELVPVAELRGLDSFAVDERPIQAALILELPVVSVLREHGVLARHRDVVEEDRAFGRAADRRRTRFERERLPRSSATRADDQRCAVDADFLERVEVVGWLRRRERLGRLALLVDDERGAALRAEVRGFRVVVPALRAVDVRHQAGGVALPARTAVSDSTSTDSRTLFPSVAFRRATSSDRRMSIFPCRSRRRYETSCSSWVSSSMNFFRSSSDSVARSGSGSIVPFLRVVGALT